MDKEIDTKKLKTQSKTLMWFARVSGLIVSAIWVYYLVRFIIDVGFQRFLAPTSNGIILFLLITTLSVGVGISWKRPLSGGKFLIVLSVLLGIFNYFSTEHGRLVAVAFQGLPYFLVGLLFIQSQLMQESES
jgi:hypothetical protein